jgi:hypothetical protein
MMKGWEKDKRWSDRFMPEIKRILGEHLLSEPPIEEDMERNTDLMVLRLDAIRIGCRIRMHRYLEMYGNEITIREGRPSGIKTELTKIIEGWGDYFFYGFSDEKEERLSQWVLGDLSAFRVYLNRFLVTNQGLLPGTPKRNRDESSWFRAFPYDRIPGFIVACETKASISA